MWPLCCWSILEKWVQKPNWLCFLSLSVSLQCSKGDDAPVIFPTPFLGIALLSFRGRSFCLWSCWGKSLRWTYTGQHSRWRTHPISPTHWPPQHWWFSPPLPKPAVMLPFPASSRGLLGSLCQQIRTCTFPLPMAHILLPPCTTAKAGCRGHLRTVTFLHPCFTFTPSLHPPTWTAPRSVCWTTAASGLSAPLHPLKTGRATSQPSRRPSAWKTATTLTHPICASRTLMGRSTSLAPSSPPAPLAPSKLMIQGRRYLLFLASFLTVRPHPVPKTEVTDVSISVDLVVL